MTCQECELLLAQNEIGSEVQTHVARCLKCRLLAEELHSNAHALRAMGEEVIPAAPGRSRPVYPWWKWTSAAAAVIITLTAAWWASRPAKPPHIVSIDVKVTGVAPKAEAPYVKAEIPEKLTPAKVPMVPVANPESLRVKMLTPDPDVVIYWLVDSKGE